MGKDSIKTLWLDLKALTLEPLRWTGLSRIHLGQDGGMVLSPKEHPIHMRRPARHIVKPYTTCHDHRRW